MNNQISATELQTQLKEDLAVRGISARQIQSGVIENPYPIGQTNVYKLYNKGLISGGQFFIMKDYFEKKSKKCSNYLEH